MSDQIVDMVKCAYCRGAYDLMKVEVTARYADCSMWKCPNCGRTVDDRGETGWKTQKDYHRIGELGADQYYSDPYLRFVGIMKARQPVANGVLS